MLAGQCPFSPEIPVDAIRSGESAAQMEDVNAR
ncbi:hypothetical protein BDSB_02825 [Burkholderia dolosa PC543]|nr:hypothetical protein BDSB_02825 [Burkholderia dolosa PC543]